MNVCSLEAKLNEIITFFMPWHRLTNCHMVEFFTDNLWEKYVPSEIQAEVCNKNQEDVLEVFWGKKRSATFPALSDFIFNVSCVSKVFNKDICIDLKNFNSCMLQLCDKDVTRFRLEQYMSPKKSHEVEIMTGIIDTISYIKRVNSIIDIGDGKGYLSSLLALHYEMTVLGIDSSSVNTRGAFHRANKLAKNWNSIVKNSTNLEEIQKSNRGKIKGNEMSAVQTSEYTNKEFQKLSYKQITHFVSEDTNMLELVREHFERHECDSFGLVGLHTCGNLSPTCLKLFAKNDNLTFLCNVGCCYHLINEMFTTPNDELHSNQADCIENCFPMSNFLKSRKFHLGRNSRMLASQSIDRVMNDRKLPDKTIFYRAVLQVLLQSLNINTNDVKIGRTKLKSFDFNMYVRKALKKVCPDKVITDDEISKIYQCYLNFESKLQMFYLIRVYLAPVIESIILIDRLLFLKENKFNDSFIVQMFDPFISPRCYGIVSLK